MIRLIFRNGTSRPLRSTLTLAGIATATAVLVCLIAFGEGYRRGLHRELDRSGVQMMLVPLGCPYDAAARVLKNNTLETALPESALRAARQDPAVEVAAPLLMAAVPRSEEHTSELQSQSNLVCRLLLEKKKKKDIRNTVDTIVQRSINQDTGSL